MDKLTVEGISQVISELYVITRLLLEIDIPALQIKNQTL